MSILEVGMNAPDFTLPINGGGNFALKSMLGQQVVVYFYPKDDTPGCTTQACDFSANKAAFKAKNTNIIGISKDNIVSHEKFINKHNLNIDLAADENGDVCTAYGVWVEKVNYGKKYMGIERSTFLIDPQGKIAKIWRKVSVGGHINAVLESL